MRPKRVHGLPTDVPRCHGHVLLLVWVRETLQNWASKTRGLWEIEVRHWMDDIRTAGKWVILENRAVNAKEIFANDLPCWWFATNTVARAYDANTQYEEKIVISNCAISLKRILTLEIIESLSKSNPVFEATRLIADIFGATTWWCAWHTIGRTETDFSPATCSLKAPPPLAPAAPEPQEVLFPEGNAPSNHAIAWGQRHLNRNGKEEHAGV